EEIGAGEDAGFRKIEVDTAADVVVETRNLAVVLLLQQPCLVAVNFLIQFAFAGLYAVGDAVLDEEVDLAMPVVKVGGAPEVGRCPGDHFEGSVEALGAFFSQHDVDDARHALRFVSRGRVGDHFHPFNHARGQLLESASAFEADESGGLAVHQDADVGTSPQPDTTFGVDLYRGDVHQNITGSTPCVGEILSDVEYLFVQ